MRLALALAAALAAPVPVPTPIGRGPAYRPPPVGPLAARPAVAACAAGPLQGRLRAHVELFANHRVVIVPAGIGVEPPRRLVLGRVVGGRCRSALRTLDPTGVVHFDRAGLTVGDLFAVWRMPLGRRTLLTLHGRRVAAFVGGARHRGDPRLIRLRDGAQIVLEVGGYVPPHRSYVFPDDG